MLIDLTNKNLSGKDAEIALDKSGITCNKNAVPYDTKPPLVTSGIRLGTPAMTSRGMKEDEMRQIAEFIDKVIINYQNDTIIEQVRHEVEEFTSKYPLYPEIK